LRYTLNFPSTDADNQGAVFNPQTQQLELLDQNVSANRREDYIKVILDHGSALLIALTTKPSRARAMA